MRGLMRDLGEIIRESVVNNFESMSSPDGVPWVDLSYSTKLGRLAKSGTHFKKGKRRTAANVSAKGILAMGGPFEILRSTSALVSSIGRPAARGGVFETTPHSVTVGSRIKYAAIHQFGGQAGKGRKVRIPARPFIGMSPQARADIINAINRHMGTNQ